MRSLEVGGLVAVGVGIRQRWRHHNYKIDDFRARIGALLMTRPDSPPPEPVVAQIQISHGLELGLQMRAVVEQPLVLPDPVADPAGSPMWSAVLGYSWDFIGWLLLITGARRLRHRSDLLHDVIAA